MKLILYGIGQGLNLVEERVNKKHEIIGYADSFAQISIFRGKPFYALEDLCQLCFDYIVITVCNRETALEVYDMLVIQCGISENHIIPFYVYANYETYRVKLNRCIHKGVRGLIFGNSYAECGYLEDELHIPFLNLAVSSQDIYYNYKTFQSCIQEYRKRLESLSYIIIDLYDYYYFNVDTSKSKYIINYIFWGGFLEEHNFRFNCHYERSFKDELHAMSYIPEKVSCMYSLFDDISVSCGVCASNRWKHIDENNAVEFGSAIKKSALNRHEMTIKENKKLLYQFLHEIINFSPKIKIILTLIPRYIKMEQETKLFMGQWEREFCDFINSICKKYDALFWNYKNRTDISSNSMFYYDVEHLNTTGARALTSILNEDLKKL